MGKPFVHWARFDPSGTRIVTASRDKTARIWSAKDGRLLHRLNHATALAEAYSFDFASVNGQVLLATIAGDTLQLWELESGRPLGSPVQHRAKVNSVRFSADGTRLITAANDGTAWVWNSTSGQQLGEALRHDGSIAYAEFSPDDVRVATASPVDDQVRLWPVLSPPLPAPGWLPDLAEALAGQRIDKNEVSQVVSIKELFTLSQSLRSATGSDFYARWANWFFSPGRSTTLFDVAQRH